MSSPNKLVTVDDADISQSSIQTRVELRENGISQCTLSALNEDGANYLNTLKLKSRVVVKLIKDSNPPTTINWNTDPDVVIVFDGTVEELSPLLSKEGQVVEVIAFGKGYGLGQMRVAECYTSILELPFYAKTLSFTNIHVGNWKGYHVISIDPLELADDTTYLNYDPWIREMSIENPNFISLMVNGNLGEYIEAFTFDALGGEFDDYALKIAELHIVGALNSTGFPLGKPTNITIKPYYSKDNGAWTLFTTQTFPAISINAPQFFAGKYDPKTQYPNPFNGQDVMINILPDVPIYVNNFKIKLQYSAFSGSDAKGQILIGLMYLKLVFENDKGNTVRMLVAGPTNRFDPIQLTGNGIIKDFIEKVYGTDDGSVPYKSSTALDSGYSINTDYVVKDAVIEENLIPFIKFPYQDGLTALQDIVKYGSSLKFNQGGVGYHWIIDVDGNLLLAPVTNHDVYGTVSGIFHFNPTGYINCVSEDIGKAVYTQGMPTYGNPQGLILLVGTLTEYNNSTHIWDIDALIIVPTNTALKVDGGSGNGYTSQANTGNLISSKWELSPYATPIKVRQDMIVQRIRQEMPMANYVLVAGRFLSPFDDAWCEAQATYGEAFSPTWRLFINGNWSVHHQEYVRFDTDNIMMGESSIKFTCSPFSTIETIIGLNDFPTDFTKLMGSTSVPEIKYFIKLGQNVGEGSLYLRCYKDQNNYFEYQILVQENEVWDEKSVTIPNIKFKPLEINKWSKVGSPEWSEIYFIGIKFSNSVLNDCDVWLDGLRIEGNIIRGAYDSTSISTYNCRIVTIKDSIANTDRIDDIPDVLPNTPLALEAMYELYRYRISRMTGEIQIPLDPIWKGGQLVWIQAEDVIPVNSTVLSAVGNPTINTVGEIGNYYVNLTNYEVFLCTNIVAEVYVWIDQNEVRYKINKWFRITKVTHNFSIQGALTSLTLTDDYYNSVPIDSKEVYAILLRAMNPDHQTRTMSSLKSGSDFNLLLSPITRDYPT